MLFHKYPTKYRITFTAETPPVCFPKFTSPIVSFSLFGSNDLVTISCVFNPVWCISSQVLITKDHTLLEECYNIVCLECGFVSFGRYGLEMKIKKNGNNFFPFWTNGFMDMWNPFPSQQLPLGKNYQTSHNRFSRGEIFCSCR